MKLARTLDAPIMTKTLSIYSALWPALTLSIWPEWPNGHLILERPTPSLFISSARRVSRITLWPGVLLRQIFLED